MSPQSSLTHESILKGGRVLDRGSGVDQVGMGAGICVDVFDWPEC